MEGSNGDKKREELDRMRANMARKMGLPATQPDGEPWPWRDLLLMSVLSKLIHYESLVRRARRAPRFIVNLAQTPTFMSTFSDLAPALLRQTSLLWSMKVERPLLPSESLAVQGIPIHAEGRSMEERFPIEIMYFEGLISPAQCLYLAGNGMHQAAVGSAIMYVLGTATRQEAEAADIE